MLLRRQWGLTLAHCSGHPTLAFGFGVQILLSNTTQQLRILLTRGDLRCARPAACRSLYSYASPILNARCPNVRCAIAQPTYHLSSPEPRSHPVPLPFKEQDWQVGKWISRPSQYYRTTRTNQAECVGKKGMPGGRYQRGEREPLPLPPSLPLLI